MCVAVGSVVGVTVGVAVGRGVAEGTMRVDVWVAVGSLVGVTAVVGVADCSIGTSIASGVYVGAGSAESLQALVVARKSNSANATCTPWCDRFFIPISSAKVQTRMPKRYYRPQAAPEPAEEGSE